MAPSAKRYSHIKYSLSIIDTVYALILLFIFLRAGLSPSLENAITHSALPAYLVLPVFLLVILIVYYFLSLPVNFYRSYFLEHKFGLSKQKIGDWALD